MPLDPGIAQLLEMLEASPYPKTYESTPEVARRAYRALNTDLVTDETRVSVGSVTDQEVAGRPARVYRPETAGQVPTLVYLHGGGFVIGDLDTHDQMCRTLCRDADVVVVAIDYRLAPEHPFPAALDDARAAVTWAADRLDELGGSDVLAVGGDSAGGNLSAVVAQEMRDRIAAQILLYPAVDGGGDHPSRTENAEGYLLEAKTLAWFIGHYVGTDVDPADPRVSPVRGELTGLPRAFVCTAEFDPLRDEAEAYAAQMTAAGVDVECVRYDGLVHGFIDMGFVSPAAQQAVSDIAAHVKEIVRR